MDPLHPSLSLLHATAVATFAYDEVGRITATSVIGSAQTGSQVIHSQDLSYDNRNRLIEKDTPFVC